MNITTICFLLDSLGMNLNLLCEGICVTGQVLEVLRKWDQFWVVAERTVGGRYFIPFPFAEQWNTTVGYPKVEHYVVWSVTGREEQALNDFINGEVVFVLMRFAREIAGWV